MPHIPGLLALAGFVMVAFVAHAADPAPAHAADAASIEVKAPPSAITVFADQATVRRTGAIDLPAGDGILLLPGVSAQLLRDSLTAKGAAAAPVQIGAVETRPRVRQPEGGTTQRAAALDAAIRQNQAQAAGVDVRVAAFNAQREAIERLAGIGLAPGPPGQAGAMPRLADDPARWQSAWTLVRDGITEAADGLRQAGADKQELNRARQALEAELALLKGRVNEADRSLDIAIAVHADQATRFSFDVSYQIPGASWRPVYEARLDSATGRMLLRQEAVVLQRTGEDWDGVALTLSTAHPSVGVAAPVLTPIRVGLVDPARPPATAALSAQAPAPAPPGVAAKSARFDAAPAAATVQEASFDAGGLAVEYRIPGAATIRADGTERKVRIGDLEQAATLVARAAPKAEAKAYLQARFSSAAAVASMQGKVALYLDGVFVGRGTLPLLRPAEAATLSFGPDDAIKVVYEPQADARSQDGFLINKKEVLTRTAVFTVKSFHKQPIELLVLDQVPASETDDLKVETIAEPPPTAVNFEDKPGVVAWTMPLKPGEERRFRFGYTLTAPPGRTIWGVPP